MQLRGATVPRIVIFQVDRREEGRRWNKLVGLTVVSRYRAVAQRPLAHRLSSFFFLFFLIQPGVAVARPTESRDAFRLSRLTDFQKQLSSFREF